MKFEHKKSLGQNFITNTNLLAALAEDASIMPTENVLEIGPGLGTLTNEISKRANKVLAIEADNRLVDILEDKFKNTNVEFIFDDFMKVSFDDIKKKLGDNYIVVANLPYYITTPILFRFFCEKNNAQKIAVMVQKEVAERICANPGSKDYGILSVSCAHFGNPKILRNVARQNFDPVPNVDSAFVLIPIDNKKQNNEYLEFVRNCFAMRRKTLVNNLKGKYDSGDVAAVIESCGKSSTARAEEFTPKEIEHIFEKLSKCNKK
ncbi:MAG: ribosomal RNA small subunit methyltransferase A [Clostridia bacterium]|nr:ribosomal RNA small subunit methyltransferase A [Clostridia bacterium]